MIGMRTILEVADNSGARRLACILPRGGDLGLRAGLGDIVTASVKEAAPDSAIKKGKVVRCVIVRMRKETRRKDGTYIRFDSNAAVLVNEVNEPVGTRVFGPVARELRDKKFMKIVRWPEVFRWLSQAETGRAGTIELRRRHGEGDHRPGQGQAGRVRSNREGRKCWWSTS
jgi:large subunit ribosomal protein L14